jgi:predicted acyltransferase (DUF342 family)
LTIGKSTYIGQLLSVQSGIACESLSSHLDSSFAGEVSVGQICKVGSNLSVSASTSIGSDLRVSGQAAAQTLSVATSLFCDSASTSQSACIGSGLTVLLGPLDIMNGDCCVGGNTEIQCGVGIGEQLVIDGCTTLHSALTVSGVLTAETKIQAPAATIQSILGYAKFVGAVEVTEFCQVAASLSVAGITHMSELLIAGITGDSESLEIRTSAIVNGALDVQSSAQVYGSARLLDSLILFGGISVGESSLFGGNLSLDCSAYIGETVSVFNRAHLSGGLCAAELLVNDIAQFSDTVLVDQSLSVHGNVRTDSCLYATQSANVNGLIVGGSGLRVLGKGSQRIIWMSLVTLKLWEKFVLVLYCLYNPMSSSEDH